MTSENSDKTAFPWRPSVEYASNLNEDPSLLDRYPCIVLWLEEKTDDEQSNDIKLLTEVAKEHLASNGYRDFGFLYVTRSSTNSQTLRAQINQPDSTNPLTLLDFN